jgi:hypothetical protein
MSHHLNRSTGGAVDITWFPDDSVNKITYQGEPLNTAINDRLQLQQTAEGGIVLAPELCHLLDDLFEAVVSLPATEPRKKLALADTIFGHLVIREYATTPRNPKLRSAIWRAILDHVWRWEDSNEDLHKGAPYYYMGETYLESGDIPSAYMCLFSGLEEDQRNYPAISKNFKEGPAYRTTSLVDNVGNRLYEAVVVPLRGALEILMRDYNARTGALISMQMLDDKFLQAEPLEDVKRFFVANFHEIYHLAPLNSTRLIRNAYSKLKVADTLFNLSLVVDQILKYRFLRDAPAKEKKMANGVYQVALYLGWTTRAKCGNAGRFLDKATPDLNVGSPDQILPSILEGTATHDGMVLNAKQSAIFTSYHLRNYGGHHIEGCDILIDRYSDVIKLVMDAFFLSVECLSWDS